MKVQLFIAWGLVFYMFGLIIYQGQSHLNRIDDIIEHNKKYYVLK
jgi:hypothetical protein